MLPVAIVFISLAMCLYTLAIWSERIKKKLQIWMIIIFSAAFTCDLIGTSMMFVQAEVKFQLCLHSIAGYVALLIMGLHLFWAIMAKKYQGNTEKYFHKFSIFAWLIWLLAFVSGVPNM